MSIWHSALARTPALALMRRRSAGLGRVMMYHRILPDDCDPVLRRLLVGAITRSAFERQLDYLGRHYEVVPLREMVRRQGDCAGLVAITFDDGYADNLWHALPALQARSMPATVFVTSAYVDAAEGVWWERVARWVARGGRQNLHLDTGDGIQEFSSAGGITQQYRAVRRFLAGLTDEHRERLLADVPTHPQDRFLEVAELRRLADAGVSIEGHTETHPRLSDLEREQARRELSESKNTLERLLDRPVELMAYPFGDRGDFDTTTMTLAREAGYSAAFAAYRGLFGKDTDLFAIPRLATRQEFDRFRVGTARLYPTQ